MPRSRVAVEDMALVVVLDRAGCCNECGRWNASTVFAQWHRRWSREAQLEVRKCCRFCAPHMWRWLEKESRNLNRVLNRMQKAHTEVSRAQLLQWLVGKNSNLGQEAIDEND